MNRAFFMVGPTATGKSYLAADVARDIEGEIVNVDAFQIYDGFNILTAKPDIATLAKAPHHLIGTISTGEEMNAEKFRRGALRAIAGIQARRRPAIVVGGSGLYLKALTHGLLAAPVADRGLRAELNALTLDQMRVRLLELDPETARKIDMKNRPRLVRALEICVMTGSPISEQRRQWKIVAADAVRGSAPRCTTAATASSGVFVFRDREELYQRINRRVEEMFENGVIEEVRAIGEVSLTAAKTIGLREIRELLNGNMSIPQCVVAIQQATRRYAKRQLTWFRRQTNFEPLNLSLLSCQEAVQRISQRARCSLAQADD